MAVGDVVATHKGVFSVSGTDLVAAINAVNLGSSAGSGAGLFLISTANGTRVAVIGTTVTGW